MAMHHPDRITLYVDGDNVNAVELYLRAGFVVEQRSMQYQRGTDLPR
jgi:mycothiol synthase